MTGFRIVPASAEHLEGWSELRHALWPEGTVAEHLAEISEALMASGLAAAFAAIGPSDTVIGFAEASLRHDYVNGCDTSPVAFLEGVFVAPAYRRKGVAAGLVAAVTEWARACGVSELASDVDIANDTSIAMHSALGFGETERVVYFRKSV